MPGSCSKTSCLLLLSECRQPLKAPITMARCTHVYNHNREVFLPFKYTNQTKTGALKDKSRHWTVLFVWHLEIRAWAAVRDGWNDKPTPCGRFGCFFPPSPPKSLTPESSNHPYTNLSRVRLKGSHTRTLPCLTASVFSVMLVGRLSSSGCIHILS